MSATNALDVAIGLPLRNQTGLSNLLQQLYDPASIRFHQYLSPQEFATAFGPTDQDYQAALEFATVNGLTVLRTHSNRMLLEVRGSIDRLEKALHVQLCVYSHPNEARTFYAPDREPSIESSAHVLHVSGLNNFHLPSPQSLRSAAGRKAIAHAGSGPNASWLGNDFRVAYVPGTSLTGAGQVVGLFELDGYFPTDIDAYTRLAGLAEVPLENVLIGGFNGVPSSRQPGSGNEEVALDIEMTISMAPGLSKVLIYEGSPRSTMANVNGMLNQMATDNRAKQLSCSWGFDIDVITQQIFQEYAAQGQSFFMASGDNGAFVGPVMQPSDNPYLTVVGGTILNTDASGAWLAETVWSGSGGGISTLYPIPSWQQGIDMSLNGGSPTMRNVPDVSMVADNVWFTADRGRAGPVSGTSIAAPLWAGFTALINEQAALNGQPAVGFLNPALYALGKGSTTTSAFHDVVYGNNVTESSPAHYLAMMGYDLCSGWGSPAGTNLINGLLALAAQNFTISPPTGFTAAGAVGGPFNVTARTYLLTNFGTAPLNWTASNNVPWLDVSSPAGTLLPGGPAMPVTVSLNSLATNLLLGEFSGTVQFSDVNNHYQENRTFALLIGNGGFERGDFTNWTFAAQEDVNFAYSLDQTAFSNGSPIDGVGDEQFVHSGLYGAFLGQNTSPGTLSQSLPTFPGQDYALSFWLSNPASGVPNQFQASWNGHPLFDQTDLPAFGWTNFQFVITATGSNSVLQFQFRNDQNAFGLDDVTVALSQNKVAATLVVTAGPVEGGSVSGGGTYLSGSQQQIAAVPVSGFVFAGWSDGNQENPRTITLPESGANYTAIFAATADLTLQLDPAEGGAGNGSGTYPVGSQHPMTVIAFPGWVFSQWSDGNLENPRTVTVPAGGATYTAVFAPTALLAIQNLPAEAGSGSGGGTFPVGSTRQISATAGSGWMFDGWSDGNQENPRTVTLTAGGAVYTATYRATAELVVQGQPSEGGAVNGTGTYPIGSNQSIAAVAFSGFLFAGWNDGVLDNPRTVTVPAGETAFVANFLATADLAVRSEPAEGGNASGSGTFPIGTAQQMTASAAPGWLFNGWNDGNQDNPRIVTVPAGGTNFTASFQATTVLSVQADPPEGGTVTGSGTFPMGSQQSIAATPAPGWAFDGWSDSHVENPRTITLTNNSATFIGKFRSAVQPAKLSFILSGPTSAWTVAIEGSIGVGYTLQTSTDLEAWTDVQPVTIPAEGSTQATVIPAVNPATFFRVIYRK